ncbi:MAG TPA: ABC transporter substrate-binding protein [Acidimicrobiales bacterium]|nr:ABC transporter substrate-binding protein [Acidimicrobiales bacterium]
MPSSSRIARACGATLLSCLLLSTTACGSSTSDGAPSDDTEATTTEAGRADSTFPMTIENCGETVTLDAPPTKAITMNQGATETMLALGLEDQMIGTAYLDDAVLPEWQDVYDSVDVLSDEYPSQEEVLATGTDFVYGSYASAFDDEAAGSRGSLAKEDIGTYLSPNDCQASDGTPVTFDDVFAEITEIGAVFGVPDRAAALVADSKDRLAEATADLPEGQTVLWYDSGDDAPFVGACCGGPNLVMSAVGATNVFDDLQGGWEDASWEAVVAADPDAIVLVDASWDTVAAKKKVLAAAPMNAMTAVEDEQFIEIPFSSSSPGVRNVSAVEQLADGLRKLDGN